MPEKLKTRLTHAVLALLLAAGALLPLLAVLDASFLSPAPLIYVGAVVLLFELAAATRLTARIAAVLVPAALAAWLFLFGGLRVVSDVMTALTLRFSGRETALPLIVDRAVPVVSVAVSLLCCFAALRRATFLPGLAIGVAVLMAVWLTDNLSLLPWTAPMMVAVFTLVVTDRHEETPVLRVLPWGAALVAVCFLLTPKSGVTVDAMKEKADELRQAIMDRLFFTEPRDVFSLAGDGWYPQCLGQLGGKPNPSEQPVLQVSAPRTVYLRGVILNNYDGRSWRNTTGGRRYLWQSARLRADRSRLFDETLPAGSVQDSTLCAPCTVSVRMLRDSASTLFVSQRIRELVPGGDLVPYFSNSSEVFATRNLQAGDTWTVTAPLMLAGDPGIGTLINAAAAFDDPAWDAVYETYTTLPDHLEQPVYELAATVSAAGTTPYEKAFAIQSWLLRNCRYTLDVEDQPANLDFVTHFLLDTKEGYCTYFASAMTVLCRMIGLPARYVEGYIAEPDETGQAVVTGLQAHAWTEVYFSGFGWLTFDATPRLSPQEPDDNKPDENPTEPSPTPSPAPDEPDGPEETETPPPEDPEPSDEPENEPDTPTPPPPSEPPEESPEPPESPEEPENPGLPPALWLLLPLLLLAALALRIYFTSPGVRERRAGTEEGRFEVWVQELADLLRADRLVRGPGETPMSFMRRADATFRYSVGLADAGECLSLIRYSKAEPLSTDTALIRDTATLLKADLNRPARLKYLLRRVFVPLKRRLWSRTEDR